MKDCWQGGLVPGKWVKKGLLRCGEIIPGPFRHGPAWNGIFLLQRIASSLTGVLT
jgi:hypothetical protein